MVKLGEHDGYIAWIESEEGVEDKAVMIFDVQNDIQISFAAMNDVDVYRGVYEEVSDGPPYKGWRYRGYLDDNKNFCSMRYHPQNETALCYWRMKLDSPMDLIEKNITPIAVDWDCVGEIPSTMQKIKDLMENPQNQLDKA